MPQEEKSIIRSLLDPTIVLDSMELFDLDTGTADPQGAETGTQGQTKDMQQHKDYGTEYPFVEINNYVFNKEELVFFEIDASSFIPTCRLKALVSRKVFTSASMPKDGDLMNVFIRSKNNAFKPIRNDYKIQDVRTNGYDSEGRFAMVDITGELFIPRFYDDIIQSYKGTSFNVLKQIAKDIGLGFASNDTETSDEQVWINPGGNAKELIKEIAMHAWKDENSFFQVFIDIYYHLNFVNVNNQFSEGKGFDMQLLTNLKTTDSMGGEVSGRMVEDQIAQTPKVLTNWNSLKGTAAYVHQLSVKNNSNFVSEKMGYKRYAQFFDQSSEKYWSIYSDALTTTGAAEDKIILKGRTKKPGAPKEEFWKTQNRYVWEGILYTAPEGNAHEKYNVAKTWNEKNNLELQKMYIEVNLERGNFNIYRGERLPLLMFSMTDTQHKSIMAPVEEESPSAAFPSTIPDRFYSGYYMVSGMLITYSLQNPTNTHDFSRDEKMPGFTQKMVLTRREWPTPV